jgi:hypothetical protein
MVNYYLMVLSSPPEMPSNGKVNIMNAKVIFKTAEEHERQRPKELASLNSAVFKSNNPKVLCVPPS